MSDTDTQFVTLLRRANKRAGRLVEAMLHELEAGVRRPERLEGERWKRLFGNRQAATVHLQKLVQALTALSLLHTRPYAGETNAPEEVPLDPADMELLAAWVREQQAGPKL